MAIEIPTLDYDELIFQSLQGIIKPDLDDQLLSWRRASPDNEGRYQAFAAVWRATHRMDSRPATRSPTAEAIVRTAQQRRAGRRLMWPRLSQVAGITLAFATGAVGVGLWWAGSGQGGPEPATASRTDIITGIGETTTTRLADGTVIKLAPGSRLILPAEPGMREVTLEGKAFFAVSADPESPFLVRTASGEARVLGTRFELDASPGQIRLLVVEGTVNLRNSMSSLNVQSHELTQMRDDGHLLRSKIDDVWPMIEWLGSFLAFESTPLSQVSTELKVRFDVELIFDDPEIADETVTVWFGDEAIDDVLLVLCRLVEADCDVRDSEVLMKRRS
jgi:ferric-dicitrate binding protein FerR (iron transport regulator)